MINAGRDRGIESREIQIEFSMHLCAMLIALVLAWKWFVT